MVKAVSDEVISCPSVPKSLVQTPSLLGHSHLPPTPIFKKKKKKKKMKQSDQICFDSSNLHSRLCAELPGSNLTRGHQKSTQQRKDAPISF